MCIRNASAPLSPLPQAAKSPKGFSDLKILRLFLQTIAACGSGDKGAEAFLIHINPNLAKAT